MYHNSMMEEEIDIEEHDVLDNPRIKHMFPDLIKVKTEVFDEEDEEVGELPDIDYIHASNCLQYKKDDYDYNEYNYYNHMEEDVRDENYTNKIILGSKPNTNNIEENIEEESIKKEYLPAVVMLEDWGDRLNNSSCFCKDCKILFATNNALDYHKMAAHSFLVAITNKAVKSTTRSSTSHIRDVDKIEDGIVTPEKVANKINVESNKLCNHCNKYFPDGNTLIKHLYELLTKDDAKSETKKSPKTANFNYQCKICQKQFLSYQGGKVHFTSVHPEVCVDEQIIKISSKREETNSDISVPRRNKSNFQVNLDADNNLNYWYSTRSFIRNPPIPQSILYKCVKCSIHFAMALPAIHHSTHCSVNSNFLRCDICKRKIRSHDILLHKLQHKVSTEFKIYQGSSRNYKKSLCKCPKCKICYSESKFWLHYKVCSGKQLNCDWCKTCGEFIHSHIAMIHMNLHKVGSLGKNDFIIIKFATDVHIKFEENIDSTVTSKKRKLSSNNTAPLKKIKEVTNNSIKKRKTFDLYYCKFCNCCIHKNRWSPHVASNCRKAKNIVCQICGLTFTQKSIVKHKELHKHYNVTLHDFQIFSRDGSRTLPKAPHFYQCYKCKIYFATRSQRHQHVCCDKYEICHICSKKFSSHAFKLHNPFHTYGKTDKTVQPVTTNKPVQPVTTEKQVQPVTTEKQVQPVTTNSVKQYKCLNKMWNILFLCESCGLNTDSYDEAVSHSQYHLVGSTDTSEQARCKVCDLKFNIKCYRSHMLLHKQLPVNKNDFLILPYRYRALFKNQWFNLFGKLPAKRVQQIISQSIYRETRRANMKMVKNGRPEYTLYVCNLCNVCVKGQDINKHLRSSCSQSNHYLDCSYCEIFFDIEENYKRHERLHKKINVEFRVVKFESMASIKLLPASRSNNCVVSNGKCFIFYKCAYCKLSVLGKGAQLKKHVCYDGVLGSCHLCGLAYRARYKNNHMRLHKKYPTISKKTVKCQWFKPKGVVEQEETGENKKKLTSKIYLVDCKTCRLFFKSRRELEAHYPKCSGKVNETVDSMDQPPEKTDSILYKCLKCPCHFIHLKSLKMHKVTCQPMRQVLHTCEICNLKFTKISLCKHKLKHHIEDKYTFKVLEPETGEILVHSG